MVDTVKILGALLGGGGTSKGSGSNILKSVLGAATQGGQGGNDLGSLLGGLLGGKSQQQNGGGLGDLLGSVLGGQERVPAQAQGGQSTGGLGGMLGSLLGGNSTKAQSNATSGGGLSDLLGGVLGGNLSAGSQSGGNDLGGLVSSALNQFGSSQQSQQSTTSFEERNPGISYNDANEQATIIIRAMINAAKSDGNLDQAEQNKIIGQLGDVTQEEIDFVNNEIARPLDINAFIQSIPANMAKQVYAMSLTAIDLDTNQEAQYLHQLAQGLNIDSVTCNQIHQQLGAAVLYS